MWHENTQVELEFWSGRIIFGTVMPLELRKITIMGHKNTQIKFRYGSIWNIFSNVMHLALKYLGVRQFLASRDIYVRRANVIALPSASASASVSVVWTKTLTLAITSKPEVIDLSYFICVFFVTRPFTWYHNFWPSDLDLEVWPTF